MVDSTTIITGLRSGAAQAGDFFVNTIYPKGATLINFLWTNGKHYAVTGVKFCIATVIAHPTITTVALLCIAIAATFFILGGIRARQQCFKDHQERIEALKQEHADATREQNETHTAAIDRINKEHAAETDQLNGSIATLHRTLGEREHKFQTANASYTRAIAEKEKEIKALKAKLAAAKAPPVAEEPPPLAAASPADATKSPSTQEQAPPLPAAADIPPDNNGSAAAAV